MSQISDILNRIRMLSTVSNPAHGETHIVVAEFNIGRAKTISDRKNVMARIQRSIPNAIIGATEVDDSGEILQMRNLWGSTHNIVGRGVGSPIMVPKRFRIISRDMPIISPAVAHLQPNRHAVSTVLRDEHGFEFVILNSQGPRDDTRMTRERKMWVNGMNRTIASYNRKGYNVFVTCDPNATPLLDNVRYAVNKGVDRIGWTSGKHGVRLDATDEITMGLEPFHNCHLARFTLTAKDK